MNPADRSAYVDGVAASIEAALGLGTNILISQVGDFREGVPRAAQHESLVEGLLEVAPLLEQSGITLVIEPLNERVNHPGYYLVRSDEAFQIIDDILDITGDQEKLGKDIGSDLTKNKATYPALYGLEESKRKAEELVEESIDCLSKLRCVMH